ncbi:MAG: riboflavin synthase [Gemmatimonadetes bacterium]|nr:riboflavin synthase [Gemmatimonadota bacterium]
MFTGLVEELGTVVAVTAGDGMRELWIRAAGVTAGMGAGDSVAVDGACLTVRAVQDDTFRVEVIGTTLSRTVAALYTPGRRVNLERPLAVGDRLGGHFVQGHVDGIGDALSLEREGEYLLIDLRVPPGVAAVTILHGSIAVNGVSLTVNALPAPDRCQVAIIPFTWEHTNLSDLRVGDPVNLEGDLIGKYVGRMLATRGGGSALTLEKLANWGY